MRVLLAARHPPKGLKPFGGVQSWTATVAAELHRLRHRVECWGPELPVPAGRFDLGIFANVGETRRVMTICNRLLMVSHGIIEPERPMPGIQCVYTSEGVRDHWKGKGPVIRQPIDLEFWSPDASASRSVLLRYSYYEGLAWLTDVAVQLGMEFRAPRSIPHVDARDAMRSATCVLASGRAALEAAACGVPIVICDDRTYQGPLLASFGSSQMKRNYSGRGGVTPNVKNVIAAVRNAMARGSQRAHVERHHDSRKIVQELLSLMS